MACGDTAAYTFDYDQEMYTGDTVSFTIDRRGNYSSDETTLTPTITFEPTDSIGSLTTYSKSTTTTVTIAFKGFPLCPSGSTCNYTDTLPPDYYTIEPIGFYNNPPQPIITINNRALCLPADKHCLEPVGVANFAHAYTGLTPSSAYKYKVRAFRGGHLYGQTQTITLTTGVIAAPGLSPEVTVTVPGESPYGARDAVISWQAPAPPLDTHPAMERFELYRQTLSSLGPIDSGSSVVGNGTGEQLCAGLPQASFPGQYTCLSSTAPGGSCSTTFIYGSATCALWDPPVRVGYSQWDPNNLLQVWVNTADQASPTRRTDLATAVVTSVTDPGVDRKPTTYRYFLVARYNSAYASPAAKSEVTSNVVLPRADTIAGFADTHVHQFGNLAHGGTLLDGRPGDRDDGSGTYNAVPVDMGGFFANDTGLALRGCDAVSTGGTGNHDFGAIGNIVLDIAGLGHDKSGIKELPNWLDHSNWLHQQAYKTALKRAVDGGMRLMVMHAVNSEFVCKVAAFVRTSNGSSPISCNDSTSLDSQLTAAYSLQSEIDSEYCPASPIPAIGQPDTHLSNESPDYECGWYRIVTNPAAARKVMMRGKLAVVLGIETATPFGCGTGTTGPWAGGGGASPWPNVPGIRPTCIVGGGPVSGITDVLDPTDKTSLQYFYNRGVRHVFPVHGINNGIGSTAISTASVEYALNEAALNGAYFRTGACIDRGAGLDPPMSYRLSVPNATTVTLPFGLASLSFTNIVGIPLAPPGYPGGTGATCNLGGPVGSTAPPFGLTLLGRAVIQEMMKRRMLIDIDHMSERTHIDTVAESIKSFNYPLVSGHTNLQRLSAGTGSPGGNEVALSTPELNEVRASGGQVNLVALGAFPTAGVAAHTRLSGNAAAPQFQPQVKSVPNDCGDSSKTWAQEYLAAVDLTRNAPTPNDNSAPVVYGVGFGSDINTLHTLLQPRFGRVGGAWSGCSPDGSTGDMTPEQQAQWDANKAGGIGKAVQYDIDMISGVPTTKGFGGIDTSVCLGSGPTACADSANDFPGFPGPRLRRSRLNEGGYLFTLYGPDKPLNGVAGGEIPTMCLDSWNTYGDNDFPRIGDCGNTRNAGQQWSYDSAPSQRIRPLTVPARNLIIKLPLEAVNNSGDFAVTYADSNVFTDYDHPPPEARWTTLASGQLLNPLTGLCLSVEKVGFSQGNRVVVSACAGGNTGLALRPDQLWARGGEEESFNLTGLSHIGMYPDLIQDLKNNGLLARDLIPLFQSAEGYLQMWERTGWTRPVEYTKLSSDGTWKYTATTPLSGWRGVAFDDTTWRVVGDDSSALAPYGAPPWGTAVAGFPSTSPAQWMPVAAGQNTYYFRRTFVTDAAGTAKSVTVSCDDTAAVYFDGIPKLTPGPWTAAKTFTFVPSSFGTHVIAAMCTNTGGPGGLLVDVR